MIADEHRGFGRLRASASQGSAEPNRDRLGHYWGTLLGARVVAHVRCAREATLLRELLGLLDTREGAVQHLFVDRVGQVESPG